MNKISAEKTPDPLTVVNGIKESGDIGYDADYGFCLFFADEEERKTNKWHLGRKAKDKFRKYMLLFNIKDSWLNGAFKDNIYTFDVAARRYQKVVDFNTFNTISSVKKGSIKTKNNNYTEPSNSENIDDPEKWG